MNHWIVVGIVAASIGGYVALLIWARRRQREFDEQYDSAKERHEVFVLIKKTVRKKPESGPFRFFKIKSYEVVGRVNLSQAVKGMQMSRMQTVTFQTTKGEYQKIEQHHSYKMDVAGTYIGYVMVPSPQKRKGSNKGLAAWGKMVKGLFSSKAKAGDRNIKQGKQGKARKKKSK